MLKDEDLLSEHIKEDGETVHLIKKPSGGNPNIGPQSSGQSFPAHGGTGQA